MKTTEEYRDLAKQRLATAQHIPSDTYPTLQNQLLGLSALEHLFLAMDYAMNAVLFDERIRKSAGEFPKTFSGRYSAFRLRVADALGFDKEPVNTLINLRNILIRHQKSPVEFERAGKFVICTKEYGMTLLSLENTTEYAKTAASFLQDADRALGQSLSMERASHAT